MNEYLFAIIISFIIQIIFFIYAFSFKTDKVTDLSYTLSFILLALFTYINSSFKEISNSIVLILIIVWGIRLGSYLLVRISKIGKDARFDEMRNNFWKFGRFWLLQAISIWVIMLPSTFMLSNEVRISIIFDLGLLIWIIGILIESLADIQKYKFLNKNRNKWISSGLWKYSRHPNYFGEILLWWGIFIMATPMLKGLQWLVIIGPFFITLLILLVSGIPLLEKSADKKFGKSKEYQKYKASTSVLIPWFKKK